MTDTEGETAANALPPGFSHTGDIAVYFDELGELLDWNPSFEEHTGYSTDEIESTTATDVFGTETHQRLQHGVTRALEGDGTTVTVSIRGPAPTTNDIDLSLRRVPDEWTSSSRVIGIGRASESAMTETADFTRLEEALYRVYEIIGDDARGLDEKIEAVLQDMRETLGTDFATLSRVEDDEYIFKILDAPAEIDLEAGESVPLEWTNCEQVVSSGETLVLDNIDRQAPDLADSTGNVEFGINSYLGTPVVVDEAIYGTFCFYGASSAMETFADWEVTFVEVVSELIGYELEKGKLADELQQRDRERYETLVTQSNDGIMVVRDGRYDFVNERFAEMTGYDKSELLGMSFKEVVAPEYHDLVEERYQRRLAGESPPDTYEIVITTADGERRMLELSSTPLPESGETAILANVRDITQRKKREQSITTLQDATERIQQSDSPNEIADIVVETTTEILDTSHAICWLHDPETQMLEPIAATDSVENQDIATELSPDRYEYEVFRDGDATQFTSEDILGDGFSETGYLLPLGDHGLLGIGYPERIETDAVLLELAETLAEHTTTALDRIERTRDLRESERRYRAIFNQTYQFTGLMEPDGTLIEANDTALEFGGLEPEDVIGEKLWEAPWFSHSEELQTQMKAAVERAAHGEFIREEVPARGAERMAVIDFSVRPITDDHGEVTLLIPEGRDITELKERERELKQERDHVRRTEELANIGGWELDLDAGSIRWTAGAKQLYGVDEEFEPSFEDAAEYFHPDDWETVKDAIADCNETGAAFDMEVRMITAIGQIRWIHLQGERIPDTDGQTIRGVVGDITKRREREQRLMVLNRVLRHNLRNQLSIIGGYAGHLESLFTPSDRADPAAETPEASITISSSPAEDSAEPGNRASGEQRIDIPLSEVTSITQEITETTAGLNSLAEKVRDFEKTIQRVEQTQSVSVPSIIRTLVETYESEYPAATIETDIDAVSIWGNEEFLRRALDELIANALEHTDQDSPSITVTAAEQVDGQVAITVADDGPGIPEMEREVLQSGEESPLLHGTGIGLWTINWLVTRLGGQITIGDNEPHGAVVTLSLPAADD